MLKRISSALLLSGFLWGCSVSRIPVNYSYNPRELKSVITGSWTEIRLYSMDITRNEPDISGELIAIQSDTVFILDGLGLHGIHKSELKEAVVHMYYNQGRKFATITGLLYIPDIIAAIFIEPAFLLLGAPWVVIGSAISIVEGGNHSNLLIYPNSIRFEELKKFSRFPQGMPPGIDKTRLHLLSGR